MERYNQAIYNSQMAQSQGMAGATTALTGGLTNAYSMRAGMLSDEEYLNLYKRELGIMENNANRNNIPSWGSGTTVNYNNRG